LGRQFGPLSSYSEGEPSGKIEVALDVLGIDLKVIV
jgi:hypothetical protein